MSYYVHGHGSGRGSRTYKSWTQMLQRCGNEKDSSYSRYGGAGIRVCARWSRFADFLADMGERPDGTSLDRIDRAGNYEPGNCRWATAREQQNNLKSNARVSFSGQELTLAEWSRELGISYIVLKQRYRVGDRPPRLFRAVESKFSSKRSAAKEVLA
jgi:hypothetical protein